MHPAEDSPRACSTAQHSAAQAPTSTALVHAALVVAEVGECADAEQVVSRVVDDALMPILQQGLQQGQALCGACKSGPNSAREAQPVRTQEQRQAME